MWILGDCFFFQQCRPPTKGRKNTKNAISYLSISRVKSNGDINHCTKYSDDAIKLKNDIVCDLT